MDNKTWLEAAQEHFDQAVKEGNYELCKDIIADVQELNLEAGRALNEQLRQIPLTQFRKP